MELEYLRKGHYDNNNKLVFYNNDDDDPEEDDAFENATKQLHQTTLRILPNLPIRRIQKTIGIREFKAKWYEKRWGGGTSSSSSTS